MAQEDSGDKLKNQEPNWGGQVKSEEKEKADYPGHFLFPQSRLLPPHLCTSARNFTHLECPSPCLWPNGPKFVRSSANAMTDSPHSAFQGHSVLTLRQGPRLPLENNSQVCTRLKRPLSKHLSLSGGRCQRVRLTKIWFFEG